MATTARTTWNGLEEFKAALRKLPEELRDEGRTIVRTHAEGARADTVANYPEVTGNLKRGVGIREDASDFGLIATVYSRARHAHLYEQGTRRQPPAPPQKRLGTHAAKWRRTMWRELATLMKRNGLEVSGFEW